MLSIPKDSDTSLNLNIPLSIETTLTQLIWNTAQEKLKEENKNHKGITSFEEALKAKRIKFLGHLIRAPNSDPTRAVTFEPNTAKPLGVLKRRIGGPKKTLDMGNTCHFLDPFIPTCCFL